MGECEEQTGVRDWNSRLPPGVRGELGDSRFLVGVRADCGRCMAAAASAVLVAGLLSRSAPSWTQMSRYSVRSRYIVDFKEFFYNN